MGEAETTSLPLLSRLAIRSAPSPLRDFTYGNFSTCKFNSLLHVCDGGTPGVTPGVIFFFSFHVFVVLKSAEKYAKKNIFSGPL